MEGEGMDGEGMDGDVDIDRMLAGLRGRVLAPEEQVLSTRPAGGLRARIRTDRRRLDVYRPTWRLLRAPWVADAVIVVWENSSPHHYDDQVFGLVFDRDGSDHLLSWQDDDLPQLGRRLVSGADADGLEPDAFAELLAYFHTAPYLRGHLVDDVDVLTRRFPGIAKVAGLHPVHSRQSNGSVTVRFHSYEVYPDHGTDLMVVREWNVLASADQPTTWTNHEIATVPG